MGISIARSIRRRRVSRLLAAAGGTSKPVAVLPLRSMTDRNLMVTECAAVRESAHGRLSGVPAWGVRFYAELERDNTREFWAANKARWEADVRAPMRALLDELEPEFGQARLFRPHRDIRFGADKSPYKTHQGALAGPHLGVGFYVQISSDGLTVGGGFPHALPAQTEQFRDAVADDATGSEVEPIVAGLESAGFALEGATLKTRPRISRRPPAHRPAAPQGADGDPATRHATLAGTPEAADQARGVAADQAAHELGHRSRRLGPARHGGTAVSTPVRDYLKTLPAPERRHTNVSWRRHDVRCPKPRRARAMACRRSCCMGARCWASRLQQPTSASTRSARRRWTQSASGWTDSPCRRARSASARTSRHQTTSSGTSSPSAPERSTGPENVTAPTHGATPRARDPRVRWSAGPARGGCYSPA